MPAAIFTDVQCSISLAVRFVMHLLEAMTKTQAEILQERLEGMPRGNEDIRPERNGQHSGDGSQRSLDPNAQAGQQGGL